MAAMYTMKIRPLAPLMLKSRKDAVKTFRHQIQEWTKAKHGTVTQWNDMHCK